MKLPTEPTTLPLPPDSSPAGAVPADPAALRARAAALGLDLDFYRGHHADLATLDDAVLLDHWERYGRQENRIPCAAALPPAEGLPSDPAALRARAQAQALDLDFYRSRYADLARVDDTALLEHWERHGRAEGRDPSFAALLARQGLDLAALPPDFDGRTYVGLHADLADQLRADWQAQLHYLEHGRGEGRAYTVAAMARQLQLNPALLPEDFDARTCLQLNPALADEGVLSEAQVQLHYLRAVQDGSSGSLPYVFDERFYAEYHDLPPALQPREQALAHWLAKGRKLGHAPSFGHLLRSQGFDPAQLLTPQLVDSILALNPDAAAPNRWALLLALLQQEPLLSLRVSADARENRDFYRRLALHYEAQGQDAKAEPLYRTALQWGLEPQVCEHLGNIALRAQRRVQALAWYGQALALGSESVYVHGNLARTLAELGRHEEALQRAVEALQAQPGSFYLEQVARDIGLRHWDAACQEADVLFAGGERARIVQRVDALARRQYALHEALLRHGDGPARRAPINRERVLIVGDFHLPQCKRYRIDQKLEQLEHAGYEAQAVSWTEPEAALRALPWHDQVIFYRVPALPQVVELIAAARTLGKLTVYEIDDLLFDPVYPPPLESYGGYVNVLEYAGLVQGMALTRAAAALCDVGLASTLPLARELAPLVRSGRCFLHRNGLDRQNVIPAQPPEPALKGYLNLFYGSGTKAHNSDFVAEALPAIEQVLQEHAHVRLTVVGYLQLPEATLRRFGERIVQVPLIRNVQAYWNYVAASDINLAVLTRDRMTDCKSELKWFEAACFGVPSVLSATQNYLDVVRDGVDGCLAATPAQWHEALQRLVSDAALRRRIGQAARERVLREYGVEALARQARQWLTEAAELHDAGWAAPPEAAPQPEATALQPEPALPQAEAAAPAQPDPAPAAQEAA